MRLLRQQCFVRVTLLLFDKGLLYDRSYKKAMGKGGFPTG